MERMEQPAETTGTPGEGLSCPWCGSETVEMVAEYGPHLMVAQYICGDCRSPFEVIKR